MASIEEEQEGGSAGDAFTSHQENLFENKFPGICHVHRITTAKKDPENPKGLYSGNKF